MIRGARFTITNEALCSALSLPDGVRVLNIEQDDTQTKFEIILIDFKDSLPEVFEGLGFPYIFPSIKRELDDQGHEVGREWRFRQL